MSSDDVKALIAEARTWDTPEIRRHVSQDLLDTLIALADVLEAATVAPAVDREALIERVDGSALDHFLKSFNGDEAGDIDYVWAEDGNTGWAMRGGNDVASVLLKAFDALVVSGLLRDVRDVQAEALEQAAAARPPAPAGRYELAVWLRERAQAIREARSER